METAGDQSRVAVAVSRPVHGGAAVRIEESVGTNVRGDVRPIPGRRLGELILKTKPIRVAFNMLSCAVLFAPWGVKPRETISGFLGRQSLANHSRALLRLRGLIDGLHPHEPNHCLDTYECERRMRNALYNCD